MSRSRLAAAACLLPVVVAASPAQAATVACVLAEPGLQGRFLYLSDGSIRVGPDGMLLSEELQSPEAEVAPQLRWLAPGVRVVEAATEADGLALASQSGVDRCDEATKTAWLYRGIIVTNRTKAHRACRLEVTVALGRGAGEMAVDGAVVVADGQVWLRCGRSPDAAEAAPEAGEARLWFDLDLPPGKDAELLLAAPAQPTVLGAPGPPDLGARSVDQVMGRIIARWRQRVIPETVTFGPPLIDDAFHAAVSSLLLFPPTDTAAPAEVAAWVSSASRARLHLAASQVVERLLTDLRTRQGLWQGADLAERADLVAALADTARYADEPGQMARILAGPIAQAAGALDEESRGEGVAPATRARVGAALRRAGDVAALAGRAEQAAQWQAATEHEQMAFPPAAPGSPQGTILSAAHVEVLAGTPAEKLAALEQVENALRDQSLPGVVVTDGAEDTGAACALVSFLCDTVAQSHGRSVTLLPALPLAWAEERSLLSLRAFPTGAGPLHLRAFIRDGGGRLVLERMSLSRDVGGAAICPPLGAAALALAVDGKSLARADFEAGPPWEIDPRAESLSMRLERPER